jgi:hypothetical protein
MLPVTPVLEMTPHAQQVLIRVLIHSSFLKDMVNPVRQLGRPSLNMNILPCAPAGCSGIIGVRLGIIVGTGSIAARGGSSFRHGSDNRFLNNIRFGTQT